MGALSWSGSWQARHVIDSVHGGHISEFSQWVPSLPHSLDWCAMYPDSLLFASSLAFLAAHLFPVKSGRQVSSTKMWLFRQTHLLAAGVMLAVESPTSSCLSFTIV